MDELEILTSKRQQIFDSLSSPDVPSSSVIVSTITFSIS